MLSNEELEQLATDYVAHWSNLRVRDKNNVMERDRSDTEWVMDRVLDIEYDNAIDRNFLKAYYPN